jgi:hypothetical protein
MESVSRRRLVDALNYSNFLKQSINVTLKHMKSGRALSLTALPQPCMDEELTCFWTKPVPADVGTAYRFHSLLLDRGESLLVVETVDVEFTDTGIKCRLPEHCRAIHARQVRRYVPDGIRASLSWDGSILEAFLNDFSTRAFRVTTDKELSRALESACCHRGVSLTLFDGNDTCYSGECAIVRRTDSGKETELVLAPMVGDSLYPGDSNSPEEPGYLLTPTPDVVFEHPVIRKRIVLTLKRISHSWFTVEEYNHRSVLFAGLVIPRAVIEIVPGSSIACKAQVMSGDTLENGGASIIEWRIAVLSMTEEHQARLFGLLQKLVDQKSYGGGKVDPGDLISFFFDTGFVYPKKYAALQAHKEEFIETYRKLYLEAPSIAKHFFHIDKGAILGHLSMIRFYESTWMLHHHAALGQRSAGIAVLNQAKDYINDYRQLCSIHMDYLLCYFRPNNRFPSKVFGGFARALNNRSHCSVDPLAYYNFRFAAYQPVDRDNSWVFLNSSADDIEKLRVFYESSESGGLMLRALDVTAEMVDVHSLDDEYAKLGLKRERFLYSLKKDSQLKAVVAGVVADMGLNMSNLTNCMHVFVLDPEGLPIKLLWSHLSSLAPRYTLDEIPVLLHPLTYSENQPIPYDKVYDLWAFDCRYASRYYDYMGQILARKKHRGDRGGAVDATQT